MSEGHILVVDDDPHISRLVRTMLAAKGYEVAWASSGEDALRLFRSEKYDLALLDNGLPGISGIDVCLELRAGSEIAIVVMSAGYETRGRALQAGANDYLKKPFGLSELFGCIQLNMRNKQQSPA
jgi:two-component system, OmpR family, KDP operon response regulator KdpE